jgi:hypothetical protein
MSKPHPTPLPADTVFAAVKHVANAVLTSETGIDSGITDTARLIVATLDARQDVAIPAHAVQPILDHVVHALNAQMETRRHIALAHLEAGKVAARLGATPTSYGDLWPCPQMPSSPTGSARPDLRVAA